MLTYVIIVENKLQVIERRHGVLSLLLIPWDYCNIMFGFLYYMHKYLSYMFTLMISTCTNTFQPINSWFTTGHFKINGIRRRLIITAIQHNIFEKKKQYTLWILIWNLFMSILQNDNLFRVHHKLKYMCFHLNNTMTSYNLNVKFHVVKLNHSPY